MAFFIGVILPYFTLAIFVGGMFYQLTRLARVPLHLHWELFPYPESLGAQLGELVSEVVSLRSIYRHKRKLWGRSLLMHWGIYLQVFWLILVLFGVRGYAWLGMVGGLACLSGALSLVLFRYTDPEMRRISTPADYLNLILVGSVSLVALLTGFYFQEAAFQRYLWGVLSFRPVPPSAGSFLLNLFLIQVFLLVLPFGRMAHFAAKYFTYHKVKWGEVRRHA